MCTGRASLDGDSGRATTTEPFREQAWPNAKNTTTRVNQAFLSKMMFLVGEVAEPLMQT